MLPNVRPNPPGFRNPIVVRASAALPAAGAWDATPTEIVTAGAQEVALVFTYTRGGAGGAFDWQSLYSIYASAVDVPAGAQQWSTELIFSGGGVVAGVDTRSRVQREYQTYQATGATVESVIFVIHLGSVIERMMVRARESGAVGTPGTLQITAYLF